MASSSGQIETQHGWETKPEETDQATAAPGGGVAGSACLFLFLPIPRFSLKAMNYIYND